MPYVEGKWVDQDQLGNVADSLQSLLGGDSWPASVNALWDTGTQAAGVLLGAQKSEAKQAAKDSKIEGGTAAASPWYKNPLVWAGAGVAVLILALWIRK